jgi:hypothetical protein
MNSQKVRIAVCFEPPAWLLASADVTVQWQEIDEQHERRVVRFVWMDYCKACKSLLSKCDCALPKPAKSWAYDRLRGIKIATIRKLGFADEVWSLDERRKIAERLQKTEQDAAGPIIPPLPEGW